jgi:hypothetical protein
VVLRAVGDDGAVQGQQRLRYHAGVAAARPGIAGRGLAPRATIAAAGGTVAAAPRGETASKSALRGTERPQRTHGYAPLAPEGGRDGGSVSADWGGHADESRS